jgi:hypothetical protein
MRLQEGSNGHQAAPFACYEPPTAQPPTTAPAPAPSAGVCIMRSVSGSAALLSATIFNQEGFKTRQSTSCIPVSVMHGLSQLAVTA